MEERKATIVSVQRLIRPDLAHLTYSPVQSLESIASEVSFRKTILLRKRERWGVGVGTAPTLPVRTWVGGDAR